MYLKMSVVSQTPTKGLMAGGVGPPSLRVQALTFIYLMSQMVDSLALQCSGGFETVKGVLSHFKSMLIFINLSRNVKMKTSIDVFHQSTII